MAAAVVFATEMKDEASSLINGLCKASRQARCGEEEGCGRRVGRLERRISGKQTNGGKERSKNLLNGWIRKPNGEMNYLWAIERL